MRKELIERIEVGAGGAASIEFTSIPQDGVDLLCVLSGRAATGSNWANLNFQFNNDTGTNYPYVTLLGRSDSGVATISATQDWLRVQEAIGGGGTTSDTFSNNAIYISNYTSSVDKSVSVDSVNENNATAARQVLVAGKHNTTDPVTSIKLFMSSNFVQYSTASLYKVVNE